MYEHIISHMENRDLKNARLISQGWKDFATPHLFRHAVFSLVAENVANLRKLADSDLGRHIERLHLDATAFVRTMTPSTYADYMSHWFAKLLQMEVPICGPLCQGNLLYVLRSDLSAPLTADHLQGAARTAFAAGYTLYSGRIEAQQVWIGKDQLYTAMDYIVARLPKLKHLETVTGWGSLPNREDHFKLWLKQNLPRETYDLIGLHDGPDRDLPRLPYSGIFETPGIASRMLHPMTVCPARALLPMQSEIAPLVVAALRALRGNKIKLETLKLPGCDAIGSLPVPWQRQGMVPVPALIGVPASMLSTYQTLTDLHKENLLLPVFKNLKSLDLQIDHTHPGFRGFYEFDSDYYRLPRAILSMKRIESLALGMQSYEHCAIQEYDVSALDVGSVFFDRSAATEEGEEGSNLPPQPPGPPPDISNLFASLAQAFGVPVSGHGSGSFAPVPASQSAVGSLGPQGPLTVPPNQGNFQPHVSVSVDDMIGAEAMDKSFPEFYDDDPWLDDPGLNLETNAAEHPKQWISEEPLVPNPWPMLRSLALWNMPTTKPDLMRLIKTVKDSLQELTLINVYYERPTRQREAEGTIAAGIQGANALFNQHSHNTPSSLPGWPTHQLVAVAPSPMFLGPGGQPTGIGSSCHFTRRRARPTR